MTNDPIVEEIHKIREQILAEFNGDLDALYKHLQRRTEEPARAGRVVAAPPHRPLEEQTVVKKAG